MCNSIRYYANIGKRLIKSPKIYFADHGLLCYLLSIESSGDWHSHPQKGSLWENLVMTELVKNHHLVPGNNLFFTGIKMGLESISSLKRKGTCFSSKSRQGYASIQKSFIFKRSRHCFAMNFISKKQQFPPKSLMRLSFNIFLKISAVVRKRC